VSMPDRPPLVKSRERRLTRRGVLWLGLRCDVRCKFCYDEHVPAAQKAWMPVDDAVRALDKFRFYYGNVFVDFMGGEPTLHPAILDITAHAASIGLRPTAITHGMHLAKPERASAFAQAGIHDFLVSVHGTGETAGAIHGLGKNNAARQMQALDNLRALGVPFRFNVTMIRDNLTELEAIAALAASKGARVVNFLTFNPYFVWERDIEISFQARHSDIAPRLMRAIDTCTAAGVEANVRYMPPCQLPGYEQHVYTGYQLPYDPHEWDYNSWYDAGQPGQPGPDWRGRAPQAPGRAVSRLSRITVAIMAAGVARQAFVLSGIVRSARFLRQGQDPRPPSAGGAAAPRFFIAVPALREAAILPETVAHFQALAAGHAATVVIITTERETGEAARHAAAGDTVAAARELAREGKCVHLHYPDPLGLKADQLNHAAACCAAMLPDGAPSSQAFLACYDADSRPPLDSLARFAQAIADHPGADVFHQSSRFESRQRRAAGPLRRVRAAVCDAGALRANRFVLGFELPRLLNRSGQVSAAKRALCSGVYAHVTGHGLCIRLSLLEKLPFPARSPLEDMHYSFILCSRGLPMVPVPSLDSAEVPGTVTAQVQQAARWFFGPARFARYLKDPAIRPGWQATMMAASAAGSAAEWTGCAVVPALACVLVAAGKPPVRATAACYAAVCAVQVVLTEAWLGAPGTPGARLARIAAFPLACGVHGAGGVLGWIRLAGGASGAGKTERGPRA